MGYQEKKSIVNIFSALLITTLYGLIIYQRHLDGRFDLTDDYQKWGVLFLIFIGVSIIARIIIYIIFHIINAIATREEDVPVEDERLTSTVPCDEPPLPRLIIHEILLLCVEVVAPYNQREPVFGYTLREISHSLLLNSVAYFSGS